MREYRRPPVSAGYRGPRRRINDLAERTPEEPPYLDTPSPNLKLIITPTYTGPDRRSPGSRCYHGHYPEQSGIELIHRERRLRQRIRDVLSRI